MSYSETIDLVSVIKKSNNSSNVLSSPSVLDPVDLHFREAAPLHFSHRGLHGTSLWWVHNTAPPQWTQSFTISANQMQSGMWQFFQTSWNVESIYTFKSGAVCLNKYAGVSMVCAFLSEVTSVFFCYTTPEKKAQRERRWHHQSVQLRPQGGTSYSCLPHV